MKSKIPALLLFVASGVSAFAAPPLVRNPYPIRVDGAPGLLVEGDFGGDSASDLVVVQRLDSIRAFINVADGPFAPVVTTPLADVDIHAATPGHLDADGFLDLAVVIGTSKVGIFHGNGDGSFRRGVTVDNVGPVRAIAAGDFNDDGDLDVAVSHSAWAGVGVYLGNGDGTLGTRIEALAATAAGLLTADFNGDGNADLVLSNVSGTSVAIGLGDGRFNATFTKSGGHGAVIGDFDDDGKLDLFAAADEFGTFHLHRGVGDGTFVAAQGSYRLPRSPGVHRLDAADVDGDGNLDVLGAGPFGGMGVLRGNGDGTFDATEYWLTDAPGSLHARDYDRDGTMDVVYLHMQDEHTGGWLYLLRGTGGGAFDGHRAYNASSATAFTAELQGLTSGDVNGDGNPDLLAVTGPYFAGTKELVVFLNDGAGNFGVPLITQVTQTTNVAQPLVGDVNGDGKLDVVVAMGTHLGNGDGTFQSAIPVDYFGAGNAFLVDITGDGKLDLLGTGSNTAVRTFVFHGSGTGSFTRVADLPLRVDVMADFNGDGRSDIAGRSGSYNPTRVGINDGNGGFVLSDAHPSHAHGVASAGDLNGDGHADLLMAESSVVLRATFGRGNGTFGDPVGMTTNFPLWSRRFTTADIDGDGALDLLTGGRMLLGNGGGYFRSHASVRGAAGLNAVADFDGDGDLDLAVHNGVFVAMVRPNVGPDAPVATAMTLTADPSTPTRHGEPITRDVLLSTPNAERNGGAISISVDGVPKWVYVLERGYWMTDHLRTFGTGTHSITFAYSGDTHHAPVSETRVYEVGRGLTEITGPTAPPRECAAEVRMDLALEHFNTSAQLPNPTGNLIFRTHTRVLRSRPIPNSSGYYVSGLSVGMHPLIAEYAGDANYEPARRDFMQIIDPAPTTASISAGSAVYRSAPGNIATLVNHENVSAVWWEVQNGEIESGQGTTSIVYRAANSGNVTLRAAVALRGTPCWTTISTTVPVIERLPGASMLYTVAPCRLVDTRGGSPLGGAADAELPVSGHCGIPAGAKSVVANVTVIAPAQSGWMSLWPADQPWPGTSSINYRLGKTRANNAIVPLSAGGRIRVRNSGTGVHYLIDVYGWFQ